jgi:hypothetical protein
MNSFPQIETSPNPPTYNISQNPRDYRRCTALPL